MASIDEMSLVVGKEFVGTIRGILSHKIFLIASTFRGGRQAI
jgi:hypothetical protein